MIENIPEWLKQPVPKEEIELNDDGSQYQPIWVIEKLLDDLCEFNWSRHSHRYSFHQMFDAWWLATSITAELKYNGMRRSLACSSFINLSEYLGNSNLLQTGIAEATKAGVKVLGSRFGYALNQRTVSKKPKRVKMPADMRIMKAYHKAVYDQDEKTIERLTTIYDIKTD